MIDSTLHSLGKRDAIAECLMLVRAKGSEIAIREMAEALLQCCPGHPHAQWILDHGLKSEKDEAIRTAVAEEREACAKLAEEFGDGGSGHQPAEWASESIAEAIRTRGQS